MRIKFITYLLVTRVLTIVGLATACAVAYSVYRDKTSNGEQRSIASVGKTQKQQMLDRGSFERSFMNGKTQGPIDVQITAVNPNPASPGSVLELEGHIEAKSDVSDLQFAWLMPEDGVAIEAGESEGQIGALRAGDEMTLHFSVRQLSESNRQVHLHVFRMVNGEAMGRMAQYNTVDQAALESEAQMKAQKIQQRLETMDAPAQGQLHY